MYRGSDSKGLCSVSTKYTSVVSFICRLEPQTSRPGPHRHLPRKNTTSAPTQETCTGCAETAPVGDPACVPGRAWRGPGSGGTGRVRPRSRKALLVLQVQTGLLEEKGLRGTAGAADRERLGEVGRAWVRRGSSASGMEALASKSPGRVLGHPSYPALTTGREAGANHSSPQLQAQCHGWDTGH